MNVEERYERTLKKNEFVLTIDEYAMNTSYQERMLLENEISGILSMKIEYKNDKKEYRYEISNKINLEEIGKQGEITYDFLKRFLLQIAENFKALDQYMLEESNVLFDPSYVYFDKDTYKLHLLFFPERNEEESDFIKLTEYLITIINQEDELAVWTAYVLEKDAKMENFSFLSFLSAMSVHEQESKEQKNGTILCDSKLPIKLSVQKKEEKNEEKKEVEFPIRGYIRLGIGFGLAVVYFVAGNLITGRYAFEYKKSIILLGILMAITIGAILWTIFDKVREKNEEGWDGQRGEE